MPGMHFICDLEGRLKRDEPDILKSLNSIIHFEWYSPEIIYSEPPFFFGCTRYEEYPIHFFKSEEYFIYLEGRIYGKEPTQLGEELNYLAREISHNGNNAENKIAEWILNTDGDFIVFILDNRQREIFIINDALGRLPLYYSKGNKKLIVSREVRFIGNLMNKKRIDIMGMAQCLLFGFPLGIRTLYEDIFRLGPGALIQINLNRSEFRIGNVHQFNFEKKNNKERDFNEHLDILLKLFCEACQNRTYQDYKNVVSLSGGLDSRAVVSGLLKMKSPFYAATRMSLGQTESLEARIAEKLPEVLSIDWKLFPVGHPTGREVLELLKIKNGLNYLGMSFILPFFRRIKKTYGSKIIFFTGDGGDKVLPYFKPAVRLKNLDKLTDFIMAKEHVFSLRDVGDLLNIDRDEIVSELRKHLESYPEKDLSQKYVHFLILERAFKWLFEGEDRNRFYFWSVAPFYSLKFFNYAMNCPDRMKKNHALYRELLLKLSPQAAAVDVVKWKRPITSYKTKLFLFLKENVNPLLISRLKRIVTRELRKVRSPDKLKGDIFKCFWEQIENCPTISRYLSIQKIRDLQDMSRMEFNNLFTIASVIEDFECRGNTIEKYSDSHF